MKRWMHSVILASLVAVVLSASTGCARFRQSSVSGGREAVVERSTLLVVVSASGTIEPAERVVLSFDTSGRVTDVLVQAEDSVKAGDVLVRLDSRQLVLSAKQARAGLASAEAQLAELKSGPRPEQVAAAEASLRAAQAQLDAAGAGRDKLVAGATDAEIASAEADLASALDKQQSAEKMHDRTMKCFTFRLPPAGEERTICPALGTYEEQARLSLAAADQGLAAAQLRVDELLAGADPDAVRGVQANVGAATAQRDSARAQLDQLVAGATEQQIASADAAIAQAEAAVSQAELLASDAQLVAPFDGIVAVVNVAEGEQTSVGLPSGCAAPGGGPTRGRNSGCLPGRGA